MYNNLIEEDVMILDNEFFKINMMFETVNKMYDIKMKELEYNYVYTESINETYVNLYTEAEEAKNEKQQGLLGRLFTAILNFIRKIRAKILRFFGNDKKASELEAKIKGNPKLANQTVEITNTVDAEKAIDEGTSFFGSLIDKIVKGTATEKDADAAEEKNKSLLSRIAIFGGGALLAAGGAKVANDKLHITEKLGNLLKREEDTKKKSNEVTQTNEQNVQKGGQALKNNSQSGNEENTKAGRRIMGSFKDFITDAGKFFTGKASELKSKINGVFSNNNDDNTGDNKNNEVNKKQEQVKTKSDNKQQNQSIDYHQSIDYRKDFAERLLKHESIDTIPTLKTELERIIKNGKYTDEEYKRMGEIDDRLEFDSMLKKVYDYRDKLNSNDQKILDTLTKKTNITANDYKELAILIHKVEDLLNKVEDAKYNEKKRNKSNEQQPETQKTNDKQQTLTSQERPKNTNTHQSKDSQVESDESKTQDDTSNKKNKCADFKNQPSDVKSLVKDAHILMSTVKDFVKTYFKIRIKSGGYDFYLLDEKQGEEILRHVGLYEQGSFIGRLDAGNKKYEAAVNDVINYSEYVLKFKDKYSSKEFYKAKGQESKYDDDDYESEDEEVEEVYEEIEEKLKKVKKQLPALKNVMFESSYDLINDILTIFENSFL